MYSSIALAEGRGKKKRVKKEVSSENEEAQTKIFRPMGNRGSRVVAAGRAFGRTEHGLHEIGGFVHVEQRTRAQRVVQGVVEFAEVVEDLREGWGKRISDLVGGHG